MADLEAKPFYKPFKDILVPCMFKDECLNDVINYKPTSDDVFIVTYPKCGTTWMQTVALYIFRKGVELENYDDWGQMCPFIDPKGIRGIIDMPRPGAFKTHLPYHLMPYSPAAKYVFVLRNPKDACVSLYYHAKSSKHSRQLEATFDEFFELFMDGKVEYGDYFDHLHSWYPHRNDCNVFYTTYEDMKEDLKGVVLRLAAFLGDEYLSAIQEDISVLNNILKYSGFEYMKKALVKEFDRSRKEGEAKKDEEEVGGMPKSKGIRSGHFRKGIIGDWRSHFSEEQSERLNRKFFERFGQTEIYEKYKPFL